MIEKLLADLGSLGFFKYLSSKQAEALKRKFHEMGWIAVFGNSGRYSIGDDEALAEGGVTRFLAQLGDFLRRQGVYLDAMQDIQDTHGYRVTACARYWTVYTAEELRRSEKQTGLLWGLSSARTFALVNSLLEEARSLERLYCLHGGNDMSAIFLTTDLLRVILSIPELQPRDRPYMPTEEFPLFGQDGS
jgi:hypothetical protein